MKRRAPEFSDTFPKGISDFSIERQIRLVRHTHEAGQRAPNDYATTELGVFLRQVEKSEPDTTSYSLARIDGQSLNEALRAFWEKHPNRRFAEVRIEGADCQISNHTIGDLIFVGQRIEIVNCNFFSLNACANETIIISESKIASLQLSTKNQDASLDVRIENSTICSWNASLAGSRSITLISTKAAKRYKRASVSERFGDLKLDRESYAQLNSWAEERGNSKLAHFARGHELSIEKEDADPGERLFFTLWSALSDYGLSFWRPLIILCLTALLFSFLLFTTGTTLSRTDVGSYVGWQERMVGSSLAAQSVRALVGSVEGIFSPFSLFSARKLVVPCQPWVALIQFFVSYFSIGLVFLFGFAVRRRFKV